MRRARLLILLISVVLFSSCNKPSSYWCKGYLTIWNATEFTIFLESNIESYGRSYHSEKVLSGSDSDVASTRAFDTVVENVDDLRIEDFVVNYEDAKVSVYYENENGERELIYTWSYASRNDDSIKQLFNLDDSKVSFDNVRHLEDDALFEIRYRFCITDDMLPQAE